MTSSEALGAAMEGQGAYNANSALQASGAALALPLLVEAARAIRLDAEDGPIVVADYGSSEGRNSIVAIKGVLPELRARSARPILVTHIDVSVNDFSRLFELVAHDRGAMPAPTASLPAPSAAHSIGPLCLRTMFISAGAPTRRSG
ncbi:MAG: hypothetical protein JO163_05525 [Methylobacteriaceae bacterium]|nr:hypothetical protein [Methylobacteriaceae bacterium]